MLNKANHLMMIANAWNNMMDRHAETVMMSTTEQANIVSAMISHKGFTVIVPSDISREQLKIAMKMYVEKTDWSAFKEKDWKAANAWLLNTSDEDLKS